MRGGFLIAAGLGAIAAAGCTDVGDGSGSASGPLWILGCVEGEPWEKATQAAPAIYNLEPRFFAGEPIGDTSSAVPQNSLIIRMQRNGNAAEINDVLYFNIPNSYQVARCLRGAYVNGQPDWDTGSGTVDPTAPPWCEPAGPNGRPRINMVPYGPVRAALTPFDTCHMTSPGPSVVSITAVASAGWIEFEHFGGAMTPTVPADMRAPVLDTFRVNYGDRLQATFDLTLDDDRTQTAIYKMINVPPPPGIGGALAGDFDFDLKRGRSAQTFP
jgi:hypothetical protein